MGLTLSLPLHLPGRDTEPEPDVYCLTKQEVRVECDLSLNGATENPTGE